MKLLFLQLSDTHLTGERVSELKIKKIISALRSLDSCDEIFLIFTGDLANSGAANEYKVARHFIGSLLSELGKLCGKFVKLF